jgi:type II secretory pathway component GspD/PulD (secretin)
VPDPGVASIIAQACESYVTAGVACPPTIANLQNNVPEIQVRELDSTLKLKSGQTMVIGGLMQQEADNVDSGTPFVSNIPVVGNLFKGVNKNVNNTELVLLIKATIVDARGDLNKTDSDVFHKFSDDPRPISF